jgi:HSP20 family protein
LIDGSVETSEERTEDKVIYSERRANRIFRSLALPGEVDSTKATAVLKDGVLEVTLPKAVVEEKTTVEVKSE